jgi:hypothetical protein
VNEKTHILDLSLNNSELYKGCEVREVSGSKAITTPVSEAANIVGLNAMKIADRLVAAGVEEITLTGAMAIWAYLVVFHKVVHRFAKVYYAGGKAHETVLITLH